MAANVRSILVTGGAGFVGSWLVRELLGRTAARIIVLDNLFNGREALLPEDGRVLLRRADVTDPAAVREVAAEARADWVFHLAALHFIPYCNAHPGETLEVNVVGTQNVLEACREHAPAALVIASTAAVYPARDGSNSEGDAADPTDIYGISKWANEKQLELFAATASTRCAAARLFNVFGPHETNPHVIPDILDQVLRGRTEIALGNVKPKRDYVYVKDVAHALFTMAAGNRHSYRTYNVGTESEHSVEEIVGHLARVSGLPLAVSVAAARVRPSDRMHLLCDARRLRSELGWRARHTLETGLAELWRHVAGGAAASIGSAT